MTSILRQQAFTLLEIIICLLLVVLILGLGIPSLTGETKLRKLQGAYERFDAFVARAQQQSARDGKPYVLAFTSKGSVRLLAADASDDGKHVSAIATFAPYSDEHFLLDRPSSLTNNPSPRWTFWPTGTCEPVNVRYQSSVGTWVASFNPLSCRGTINSIIAP